MKKVRDLSNEYVCVEKHIWGITIKGNMSDALVIAVNVWRGRMGVSSYSTSCGPYFVHINCKVNHNSSRVSLTLPWWSKEKKFSCHIRMINGNLSSLSFLFRCQFIHLWYRFLYIYMCIVHPSSEKEEIRRLQGYFKWTHTFSMLNRLCCHS